MTAAGLGCHFCLGHTLQNSKLRVWLALLHISRTVDYCGRMHAQLLTPSKVKLHNLGIQSTHDERSSTTAAQQQQQHSSGGDVGGPEEAPLVAPVTCPFSFASPNSTERLPHRGVASVQTKVEG